MVLFISHCMYKSFVFERKTQFLQQKEIWKSVIIFKNMNSNLSLLCVGREYSVVSCACNSFDHI